MSDDRARTASRLSPSSASSAVGESGSRAQPTKGGVDHSHGVRTPQNPSAPKVQSVPGIKKTLH
eukprot:3702303-Prymnesium_polylepis.2